MTEEPYGLMCPRTDLWEPWAGNRPGPPGHDTGFAARLMSCSQILPHGPQPGPHLSGLEPVHGYGDRRHQVSDEVDTASSSLSETLSYTWTGSGANALPVATNPAIGFATPQGNELLSSQYVTLKSLSRSLANDLGQVYEEDDYVNLAGVTYSAATGAVGDAGRQL